VSDDIARYVSIAGRAVSSRIAEELAGRAVSRGEYRVLLGLYDEDGVPQRALCDRFHLDRGVVARVVGRLEQKGYVERRPDPEDRRRKLVSLTDRAERLRPALTDLQATLDDELTAGLSDEEVETLVEGLRQVCSNLGVEDVDVRDGEGGATTDGPDGSDEEPGTE
jgi:DNA-binding MarR family transcriptional regulator